MKTQSRPFVVTVKKQRRSKSKSLWSDTPNFSEMLAEMDDVEQGPPSHAPSSSATRIGFEARSAGGRQRPSSMRDGKSSSPRILDDLTPSDQPTATVELEPSKRPRGRPRKSIPAADDAVEVTVDPAEKAEVLKFARRRAAPVKRQALDETAFEPSLERSNGPDRASERERAILEGEQKNAPIAADGEQGTESRVASPGRWRTGTGLRRGERWKRHLPRWKR